MEKKELEKNTLNKIEELDFLSQSQKDRMGLELETQKNLFGFLQSKIQKALTENELKVEVEKVLLQKIKKDKDEPVSINALTNVLNVLNKFDSESALNILGVLKEKLKVEINIPPGSNIPKDINNGITAKEMQGFKKLINIIDKLGDSEFSSEEKI